MPNSCTVTPARLATTKWPNSWITTRTTRMARRITTSRTPFPIPVNSSGISASRRVNELRSFGPGTHFGVQGDQFVQVWRLRLTGAEAIDGISAELGDTGKRKRPVEKAIHGDVVCGNECSAG